MTGASVEGSDINLFADSGTANIVGTISQSGIYTFLTDLGAMRNGDEVELRIGAQVAGAGTLGLAYFTSYSQQQATQIKISPPIPTIRQVQFSIKMTAGGTTRSFVYQVISL